MCLRTKFNMASSLVHCASPSSLASHAVVANSKAISSRRKHHSSSWYVARGWSDVRLSLTCGQSVGIEWMLSRCVWTTILWIESSTAPSADAPDTENPRRKETSPTQHALFLEASKYRRCQALPTGCSFSVVICSKTSKHTHIYDEICVFSGIRNIRKKGLHNRR